jgi:hypothetical protein
MIFKAYQIVLAVFLCQIKICSSKLIHPAVVDFDQKGRNGDVWILKDY